jgi:hypothetical protein
MYLRSEQEGQCMYVQCNAVTFKVTELQLKQNNAIRWYC